MNYQRRPPQIWQYFRLERDLDFLDHFLEIVKVLSKNCARRELSVDIFNVPNSQLEVCQPKIGRVWPTFKSRVREILACFAKSERIRLDVANARTFDFVLNEVCEYAE